MNIKGLIFDLDGVLTSTDEFHYQAWKKLSDRLNIPFDRKFNDNLRGISRVESLNLILKKSDKTYSEEEKLEFMEEKNNTYLQLLDSLTPKDLFPHVRDTLEKLHQLGYKLALGSASKNAKFILKKTEILDCFDVIVDGNDIKYSKPNPEVFLLAAQRLNIQPGQMLVIDDAFSGLKAAKNGGFIPVGFGPSAKNKLAKFGIFDISQIFNII